MHPEELGEQSVSNLLEVRSVAMASAANKVAAPRKLGGRLPSVMAAAAIKSGGAGASHGGTARRHHPVCPGWTDEDGTPHLSRLDTPWDAAAVPISKVDSVPQGNQTRREVEGEGLFRLGYPA